MKQNHVVSRMTNGVNSVTTTQRGGGGGVLISKQQRRPQNSSPSNRKYTIKLLNKSSINETPPRAALSTTIHTRIRPIPPSPLVPSTSFSPPVSSSSSTTITTARINNNNKLSRIDIYVGIAYFCNMFTITLPIILVPIIGQQHSNKDLSSFVGRVASIAIMGGGLGKIINGLICQKLGGIKTASTYLIGLGLCSLALSLSSSNGTLSMIPWLVAGMEFFSSAMWVACSVILSNYHHSRNHHTEKHSHSKDAMTDSSTHTRRRNRRFLSPNPSPNNNNNKAAAMKFAEGITFLSLSSTIAQLSSKMIGSILLKIMDWRKVAQLGFVLTIIGSLIIQTVVSKEDVLITTTATETNPTTTRAEGKKMRRNIFQRCTLLLPQNRRQKQNHSSSSSSSSTSILAVIRKAKSVVTSKLFWLVGIAHVSGFLARTSDRMMGPFLRDVTGLSYHICGGLTVSITIGFALGVMKANSFFKLDSIDKKNRQLLLWYGKAIAALLGLILVGNDSIRTSVLEILGSSNVVGMPWSSIFRPDILLALWVITCSGILASSVAFQFYQVPSIVSTVAFNENKAICLSFLEGLAFFLSAPLWAMSSHLVERVGWSASWTFVTIAFGLGASLMMHTLQPVLKQQHQQQY